MMKCPNCGAEAKGKFCEHCGAALTAQGTEKTNSDAFAGAGNILGFDLADYTAKIANAMKLQKEYDQTGVMSEEMLREMQSGFGLGSVVAGIEEKNRALDEQIAKERDARKKARAAIAKRICPECGTPFKKRQEYCKSCGASVMMESYEEI